MPLAVLETHLRPLIGKIILQHAGSFLKAEQEQRWSCLQGPHSVQPPRGRRRTFRASVVEEKGLSAPKLDYGAGTAWDPLWMLAEGREARWVPGALSCSLILVRFTEQTTEARLSSSAFIRGPCSLQKRKKKRRFRGGLWAQESRPDC